MTFLVVIAVIGRVYPVLFALPVFTPKEMKNIVLDYGIIGVLMSDYSGLTAKIKAVVAAAINRVRRPAQSQKV